MQAYAAQQYTMHQYAHQLSRPKQQQQQLSLQQRTGLRRLAEAHRSEGIAESGVSETPAATMLLSTQSFPGDEPGNPDDPPLETIAQKARRVLNVPQMETVTTPPTDADVRLRHREKLGRAMRKIAEMRQVAALGQNIKTIRAARMEKEALRTKTRESSHSEEGRLLAKHDAASPASSSPTPTATTATATGTRAGRPRTTTATKSNTSGAKRVSVPSPQPTPPPQRRTPLPKTETVRALVMAKLPTMELHDQGCRNLSALPNVISLLVSAAGATSSRRMLGYTRKHTLAAFATFDPERDMTIRRSDVGDALKTMDLGLSEAQRELIQSTCFSHKVRC